MNMSTSKAWIIAVLFLLASVGCASSPGTDSATGSSNSQYKDFLAQVAGGSLAPDAKDDQGRPAVITAVLYGSNEDLQRILNSGADPDAIYSGVTALHFAVSDACQGNKVGTLISAGADVNQVGKVLGSSPLHLAAQHEDPTCLVAIAEAGANVDVQDDQGRTAYFYAIDFGSEAAVETLSSLGADPTIPSADGLDIFKYAIASDKAGLVKPLVFKLVEKN